MFPFLKIGLVPARSHIKNTYSVAFSPQANYTDRAAVAFRRSYYQLLRAGVVAWPVQWIPTSVNRGSPDRSRYIFIQMLPHLSFWVWVDPIADSSLLRKSDSVGNRTGGLWVCCQEVWLQDNKDGRSLSCRLGKVFWDRLRLAHFRTGIQISEKLFVIKVHITN
jgi:hypothetical protein